MNRVPYLSIMACITVYIYIIIIFVAELLFFITAEKPDLLLLKIFHDAKYEW